MSKKKKVLVLMSGGIDSSVACVLLKEQGWEVLGAMMKIYNGKSGDKEQFACYGAGEEKEIELAHQVARTLKIPFYLFDLRKEYEQEILEMVKREYLSGRTPNPCARCNARVKFQILVKKAQEKGIEFDYIASGHYARVEYEQGRKRFILKKARDKPKDQSYFLYALTQEQLSRILFPVGELEKKEVRRIARELGLACWNKPESQDFIAGGYQVLFEEKPPKGEIVDGEGKILGRHPGIVFYTIGQRKGLKISCSQPYYVREIDAKKNRIIVGKKEELYDDELIASSLNWISLSRLNQPIKVKAKIRARSEEMPAIIFPWENNRVRVKFQKPQWAITPGQVVVFYDQEMVVGGGIIEKVMRREK